MIILAVSITLQAAAALLALRLVRVTKHRAAWALIATAVLLMTIRRTITFYQLWRGGTGAQIDVPAECVALVISVLMLLGITFIAPMFRFDDEAQGRLRDTYRLLQAFSDNLPGIAFVKDANGRYVYYSKLVEERFRWKPEHWKGKTDSDLFPPDVAEVLVEHDRQVLTTGEPGIFRETGTLADGAKSHWLVSKFPMPAMEAAENYLGGFAIEISEQVRAYEAVRESEIKHRAIVENAPISLWELDLSRTKAYLDELVRSGVTELRGHFDEHPESYEESFSLIRIVDVNPATVALFGADSRERLLEAFRNSFREDLRELYADELTSFLSGDTEFGREVELRTIHGEPVHAVFQATIGEGYEESWGRVFGSLYDVTDRTRKDRLQHEHAALLDLAPSAIILVSIDGQIQYWNKAAERIYGWTASEAVGRIWTELLTHEENQVYSVFGDRLLLDEHWEGELQQQDRDGTPISVEARWIALSDRVGRPLSILMVNTDITEKKKLESQFLHSQRLECLGEIAGGIAHDLNNILTPIMMSIESLRYYASDPEAAEILDTLAETTVRGADIVQQVLIFGRSGAGDRVVLQLRHLLRDFRKVVQETFPRSIAFSAHADSGLFPVTGDATQIHQILMNLCINARDAMPDGGKLRVWLENATLDQEFAQEHVGVKPGHFVALHVEDTGCGIAEEELGDVFEPFYTTKPPGRGTGLGLATVQRIVESMNGCITVESRTGTGTKFTVYLPASEATIVPRESGVELERRAGEGECVLVVDDEAAIRSVAKATLESNGYSVLTASDGIYGLYLFAKHSEDIRVVLADISMPRLDGVIMMRAMRKISARTRLVALSGAPEGDRFDTDLQVDAILNKPFTSDALLHALQRVVGEEPKKSVAAG